VSEDIFLNPFSVGCALHHLQSIVRVRRPPFHLAVPQCIHTQLFSFPLYHMRICNTCQGYDTPKDQDNLSVRSIYKFDMEEVSHSYPSHPFILVIGETLYISFLCKESIPKRYTKALHSFPLRKGLYHFTSVLAKNRLTRNVRQAQASHSQYDFD